MLSIKLALKLLMQGLRKRTFSDQQFIQICNITELALSSITSKYNPWYKSYTKNLLYQTNQKSLLHSFSPKPRKSRIQTTNQSSFWEAAQYTLTLRRTARLFPRIRYQVKLITCLEHIVSLPHVQYPGMTTINIWTGKAQPNFIIENLYCVSNNSSQWFWRGMQTNLTDLEH